MATDIDAVVLLLAEIKHGVGEGVVFPSGELLVAVPLELVAESCDGESFGEPVLVVGVVDDEFGAWELGFVLFDRHCCSCYGVSF